MPIERHVMPLITNDRYTQYYVLPGRLARDHQNRYGTVRVHQTLCDFFRNWVTIPEVDPSHPTDTSKTFNRGSLIAHLNQEIGRGHITGDIQPLSYGYCGGWIGGTGDRRIREAYNAVFSYYSQIEQADAQSLAEERRIDRADLIIKLPSQTGAAGIENDGVIAYPLADEKTYFEGAVRVRLYRQGEFELMNRATASSERTAACILEIITKDQEVDGQALINAIAEDRFIGTFYPIVLQAVVLRSQPSQAADRTNSGITYDDVVSGLIRSFRILREQHELATPRILHDINLALVEGSEVIAENSPLFPEQYPLKESHPNIGGIEGVDLYVYHIAKGTPYSIPVGGNRPGNNHFFLKFVIRNNEVDVPVLMRHVESMRFQNLPERHWEIRIITVALDPAVFPDPQAGLARRQEIIEAIRAWQPFSSEAVAFREAAEKTVERLSCHRGGADNRILP